MTTMTGGDNGEEPKEKKRGTRGRRKKVQAQTTDGREAVGSLGEVISPASKDAIHHANRCAPTTETEGRNTMEACQRYPGGPQGEQTDHGQTQMQLARRAVATSNTNRTTRESSATETECETDRIKGKDKTSCAGSDSRENLTDYQKRARMQQREEEAIEAMEKMEDNGVTLDPPTTKEIEAAKEEGATEFGPPTAFQKYTVLSGVVANMRVKEKRDVFKLMRMGNNVDSGTLLTRYGFTAGEFSSFKFLNENTRKSSSSSLSSSSPSLPSNSNTENTENGASGRENERSNKSENEQNGNESTKSEIIVEYPREDDEEDERNQVIDYGQKEKERINEIESDDEIFCRERLNDDAIVGGDRKCDGRKKDGQGDVYDEVYSKCDVGVDQEKTIENDDEDFCAPEIKCANKKSRNVHSESELESEEEEEEEEEEQGILNGEGDVECETNDNYDSEMVSDVSLMDDTSQFA
jgi:hypothetical protein